MLLHIRHETLYRYDALVRHSTQTLRLTPRREHQQRTLHWRLTTPGRRTEQVDAHGNIGHLLTYDEPHREIRLLVEGVVDVLEGPYLFERGPIAPQAYVAMTALTDADSPIRDLARAHESAAGWTAERLLGMACAIRSSVKYRPGTTTVADTAHTAFGRGEGVCQDQAHVFLACARAAGVPARYVSGYLLADGSADVASHAWVDVWLEERAAWLGIDVTHASLVGTEHCRLAVGRDYLDAAPVRGVRRGGGHETLEVNVVVAKEADQQ